MPIYDYRCNSCGNRFDLRQSFSDEPGAKCAQCGGSATRVLHPVGIVFKGSGWHATDYRSSNARGGATERGDSASNDSKSGSKSESKTESKTESKSESKSEPKSESKSESKSEPASSSSTSST